MNVTRENKIVVHKPPPPYKEGLNLLTTGYVSMQVGGERLEEGKGARGVGGSLKDEG